MPRLKGSNEWAIIEDTYVLELYLIVVRKHSSRTYYSHIGHYGVEYVNSLTILQRLIKSTGCSILYTVHKGVTI